MKMMNAWLPFLKRNKATQTASVCCGLDFTYLTELTFYVHLSLSLFLRKWRELLCQNAIGHVGLLFIPSSLFKLKSNNYLDTKRCRWEDGWMDERKGGIEGRRGVLSK